MNVPESLIKTVQFKTDIKSLLRGLNSILGLNMSRSRLRSVRIDKNKVPFSASSQYDLIKFGLITDPLTLEPHVKGVKYDEDKNEFEFISSLSGDPKEALFLFEEVDSTEYIQKISREDSMKADSIHFYSDYLSAVLDSFQINNGILFLFHSSSGSYIVNRSIVPDPETDQRFYFYSRLFKVENEILSKETNFLQVSRYELSVTPLTETSSADKAQMIIPIVHLYDE